VELGLIYLFRSDDRTIACVDRPPTSIKSVGGELVDAEIVCVFPA